MFIAFLYQLLIDLLSQQRTYTYSAFIRDIVRSRDIQDFHKLGEFWESELHKLPVNDKKSSSYFFFILKQALLYFFHRRSPKKFQQIVDLAKHRFESFDDASTPDISMESWNAYIHLIEKAFKRILRHIPIDEYEAHLDQLDWDQLDKSFIADISSLIGFTYLNEESKDQKNKARLWIYKALNENVFAHNISNYLFMAEYHFQHDDEDQSTRIEGVLEALRKGRESMKNAAAEDVVQLAMEDLEAAFFTYKIHLSEQQPETFQTLKETIKHYSIVSNQSEYKEVPAFSLAHRSSVLANACQKISMKVDDTQEKNRFIQKMSEEIDFAIAKSKDLGDELLSMHYRLLSARMSIDLKQSLTEKELKEIIQYYRKQNDYPSFVLASHTYAFLLIDGKQPGKSLDVILDVFKLGNKNIDEGGFFLLYKGFKLANDVFLVEIEKPGVSWLVSVLDVFFAEISQIIDRIESLIEISGNELLELFRIEYIRFDPVANFNIKVYFRFQLYGIKLLYLGNLLKQDNIGIALGNNIIEKLESDNNPLQLINGDWEDFKDIPNEVRNKTLNRCINISKGDLPLAAEHLDFSYRNLRSYITFKEVNRLGFFLDLQETDNKQLEQGIRYIFYDLYKKGTIFEVVFDMPKFLVKYSKSGFYSQDLENELHIKGTTAKKYIKIMIEIGLIRQDKTTGRKHYYRLIRENVMKRLGREQNMLIE